MKRALVFLLVAVASASCVIAAIDLSGKPCPCPTGWTCSPQGFCEPATEAGVGPDGSRPADASSEAMADAPLRDALTDAGRHDASWCSRNAPDAFFCCDFDEPGGLASCVLLNRGSDPGATSIDHDQWSSPPASLLAHAPGPLADGATFSSYALRNWTTDGSTAAAIHFAYDVLITAGPDEQVAPGGPALLYPNDAGKPTQRQVGILVYPSMALFQEQVYTGSSGHTVNEQNLPQLPPGWNRIAYDITLESDSGPATCTVTIADAGVLDATPLSPGWTPGQPQLAVGIAYAPGPQSAPSVNIDNVTLDIR